MEMRLETWADLVIVSGMVVTFSALVVRKIPSRPENENYLGAKALIIFALILFAIDVPLRLLWTLLRLSSSFASWPFSFGLEAALLVAGIGIVIKTKLGNR
jgi:hypothetical protein